LDEPGEVAGAVVAAHARSAAERSFLARPSAASTERCVARTFCWAAVRALLFGLALTPEPEFRAVEPVDDEFVRELVVVFAPEAVFPPDEDAWPF